MSRIIRFHEIGGPEVLRIEDVDTPPPGVGEVRIAVKAIGLNRAEEMFRTGNYESPVLPSRIGYEPAGIIQDVGEGANGFAPGDVVSVIPTAGGVGKYGTYGEVATVPATSVVKHPSSLSFVDAAAVWMQYVTAYGALIDVAGLTKGDIVVVNAASSSVGLAAIQIANLVAATPVATTRTSMKRDALLRAGAKHVIATREQDLRVTVAEEMHFGRAAQRLHMAQQPLSAQVRELEREIGHELFERYANRIRLTPAGQVFLREARAILERSDSAIALARRAATGEVGVVRVGFCSTAMEQVLPAAIRVLKAAHPAIGLDLHELSQSEQLHAIELDELDVGFIYRPIDERTFGSLDLFEEGVVVAVPSDHPLVGMSRVTMRRLAQEPLVLFSREGHPAVTAIADQVLRAGPAEAAAAFTANDKGTALALVAHGLGVAFLPENAVVPRRDVAYVPLGTPARLQFAAVWSKLAPERIVRQRFLDTLAAMPVTASASVR